MTDLRTAAQQALEALQDFKRRGHWGDFDNLTGTLQAALAEPVQEPVAWLWQHRETGRTRVLMPNERTATDVAYAWDVVGPLYLAPPASTRDQGEHMTALRTAAQQAQPEALRLADALNDWSEGPDTSVVLDEAAAELRRLYAQRDALLEALKQIEPILARMYGPQAAELPPMQIVRAAIAKCEENT